MKRFSRREELTHIDILSIALKSAISKVKSALKKVEQLIFKCWSLCKEIFISFSIRKKLSIILVLIVIIVITILSIIYQQSEERILKAKLQDICNLSVKYLSYDIKDWLLLEKYEEIIERVLAIKQQQIDGLDYAWVINKDGQFLAHTDEFFTIEDNKYISAELKDYLFKLKDIDYRETSTHYEFYYPIFFPLIENGFEHRKFVGVAGIGFLKDVILMPVRDAQKIIFTIALLVTIISILGIYFLSQQMVKQIKALSNGAKKISEGDFNVKISVNTRDELGRLADEFNNMAKQLKEKLHMQKFVSQMTRQMIKRNIISDDNNTNGEQREVAVLFADVRNFSQFAQRHDPQFVIELVNIYLDLQARIIQDDFGVVDKFIGDQVMGVFEGKQRSENVIKAAVDIQKAIRKLNEKRRQNAKKYLHTNQKINDKQQKQDNEILTVGIGINTGLAVVGNIGSKDRKDYTVVGKVINVASQFCDIAKPGQIVTSMDFYNQANSYYPAIKLDPIPLKGSTEPIEICEIDYQREIIV